MIRIVETTTSVAARASGVTLAPAILVYYTLPGYGLVVDYITDAAPPELITSDGVLFAASETEVIKLAPNGVVLPHNFAGWPA